MSDCILVEEDKVDFRRKFKVKFDFSGVIREDMEILVKSLREACEKIGNGNFAIQKLANIIENK